MVAIAAPLICSAFNAYAAAPQLLRGIAKVMPERGSMPNTFQIKTQLPLNPADHEDTHACTNAGTMPNSGIRRAIRGRPDPPYVNGIGSMVLDEIELREHFIEIYDARNRSVVATLEVLSPVNKLAGAKRATFLVKRRAVMASPAHWIEIDLLRGGERPPEVAGKSDYYALLKRGGQPGPYEVWYADLRDPLPTIAVPLRDPFADVPLDLQAAFATAYAEARYDDQLQYEGSPPPPPLRPADASWAAALISAWRK
jgi:hypothetical protein